MFRHLQIYDPRERVLVGLADAGLTVAAAVARLAPVRRKAAARAARADGGQWPRRILLLRLERIGEGLEFGRGQFPTSGVTLNSSNTLSGLRFNRTGATLREQGFPEDG